MAQFLTPSKCPSDFHWCIFYINSPLFFNRLICIRRSTFDRKYWLATFSWTYYWVFCVFTLSSSSINGSILFLFCLLYLFFRNYGLLFTINASKSSRAPHLPSYTADFHALFFSWSSWYKLHFLPLSIQLHSSMLPYILYSLYNTSHSFSTSFWCFRRLLSTFSPIRLLWSNMLTGNIFLAVSKKIDQVSLQNKRCSICNCKYNASLAVW